MNCESPDSECVQNWESAIAQINNNWDADNSGHYLQKCSGQPALQAMKKSDGAIMFRGPVEEFLKNGQHNHMILAAVFNTKTGKIRFKLANNKQHGGHH